MQKYTEIESKQTVRESRALLLNNDKTVMSCNSGTSFPTANLVLGMDCYKTDEKKLYKLVDVENQTWQVALDFAHMDNTYVEKAKEADNATTVNGHTVNADVPKGAKFTDTTYEIATDSKAGLMTATQKTKLDGLSEYNLPVATSSVLGGVKVGNGLSISNTGLLQSTVVSGNATHGTALYISSGTFTVPNGVNSLCVTAIGGGGGGGGGGGSGFSYYGGNGGHGSVTSSVFVPVTSGQSIPVIVAGGGYGGGSYNYGNYGAGGAGGYGNPYGNAGGASTSNPTSGGSGGSKNNLGGYGGGGGYTSVKTYTGRGGGGGGASSFGDYVYASGGGGGGGGGNGPADSNTQKNGYYGGGGGQIQTDFLLSSIYGAGGAGAYGVNTGGNGNGGCVFIRW